MGLSGSVRERNHFTATVRTTDQQQQQQQMHGTSTPQLLSSVKEHSSPFHKYYRH